MSDEIKQSWSVRFNSLARFLKAGDSVSDKCDILSFSHGMSAEAQVAGSPRRVHMYDVSVVRYCDAATPVLMRLCQTGESLPSVVIEMRAEKDGKELYRMAFEILNARVSRINPGGSSGSMDYRPIEDIGFTFEKLRVNVTHGEQNGSAELTPPSP
ncbi:MAG: type VI secretion system tube protein Hcp [Planctomycetes bacterium]|nr:type VI secretion system tube protein Hcp [Planctomycetota bacterium]MCA8936924.1 type VI secretion system tube protein Hcp [Planctomycetota bacterium]MCA8946511.1 type VI secretion system tube protein Hcp [Planctomycetota bacterium]